jgi:adenylylsulfate kinase-like enzyme
MILKKYNGIWFFGLSGSGKTLASNFLKKKIKKFIILDGDKIRKHISFDLSYSLKDREIQLRRVYGMALLSIDSGVFPVISTVYMSNQIVLKLKRKNILPIQITRDFQKIKNRKKIYNINNKNVVGRDIKMKKFARLNLINNSDSIKNLKKKLLKIIS